MLNLRYLIRLILFGQIFIWIYLFNNDGIIAKTLNNHFNMHDLFIFSFLIQITISIQRISFEFYKTELLIFYIALVCYVVFRTRKLFDFKRSLCMGFLLVYINSFYWESMLHLTAFLHAGLTSNIIPQIWRIVPIIFIYNNFKFFDRNKIIKIIIYGFIISASYVLFNGLILLFCKYVIANMSIIMHTGWIKSYARYLTRFLCLHQLIKIFDYSAYKVKKMGVYVICNYDVFSSYLDAFSR